MRVCLSYVMEHFSNSPVISELQQGHVLYLVYNNNKGATMTHLQVTYPDREFDFNDIMRAVDKLNKASRKAKSEETVYNDFLVFCSSTFPSKIKAQMESASDF